jgi:tetratricopeptide (TPR) repeat protein
VTTITIKLNRVFLLTGLLNIFLINNIKSQDLTTAITYTKSEKYDAADEIYKKIIQNEPNNSKAYFFYGENRILDYFSDTISNSLVATSNQAREIFNNGVKVNSSDPLNYIGLAKVDFYNGNDSKAEQMRTKAKNLLPPYKKVKKILNPKDYAYALAKIAESYIRGRTVDTSRALPLLREAVKIDKTNPDIYIILGDIYILVNDGTKSIFNYKLAQTYDPGSPTANMKIGSIYVRGLNLMAAIPYYEEAIKLAADYAPAYRELGQLYSMAGRYDQSKEYFKTYLDLTKGNIPAKIRYVNALFYAKEYDEVVKTVEEIFAVDQTRNYLNRIAAYSCYEMENGDMDKALNYITTLFKTLPEENLIKKDYTYRSKILLKKNSGFPKLLQDSMRIENELDAAYKNLENAKSQSKPKWRTKIDSLNTMKALLHEEIRKAEKEIDLAFVSYHKALKFDQKDVNLLAEIANNYYTYKKYEGAARTWEKMLELGRNDVNNYMQIGRAYYMAKNYSKADSVFKVVTTMFPDNIQSYLMIARTYSQMDPDSRRGLAKPKFETFIKKASVDTVQNAKELVEAFQYLGYYNLKQGNYNDANYWYDRILTIDPKNTEFLVRGYSGKANVAFMMSELVKELDAKLPYFDRSINYYSRALEADPGNQNIRSSLDYVTSVKKNTMAHINPNELKGTIKNPDGQPIVGASIRVKDTAAETVTNVKGEFKFEIPLSSEVLIISAKGHVTQEIPITKTRTYNVVLQQN